MATSSGAPGTYQNALLAKLSPGVVDRLSPQPLDWEINFNIYEPKKPIEYAYFPEAGIISIVALMENGGSIEIGTIGREGMAGSILLLKVNSVPHHYYIQVSGRGYRVGASRLLKVAAESEELRDTILHYEAEFRTHTMQGMACNGLHSVEQRCCRWLLMTRDRVDSDDLKLTHEFLALMLGVRRASVSEVLAPLKEAGLVKSNRGTISILNRKALEVRVCECYWITAKRERSA